MKKLNYKFRKKSKKKQEANIHHAVKLKEIVKIILYTILLKKRRRHPSRFSHFIFHKPPSIVFLFQNFNLFIFFHS